MKDIPELQRRLVQTIAEHVTRHAPKDDLAFMNEQELEAMVWGYPDDPSEPLVLFALMTHPDSPGKAIPEDEFGDWINACSSRLCLEWLRRRGAILHYEVRADGASWSVNPLMLTTGFLDTLSERHAALHRFATYVQRHALGLASKATTSGSAREN